MSDDNDNKKKDTKFDIDFKKSTFNTIVDKINTKIKRVSTALNYISIGSLLARIYNSIDYSQRTFIVKDINAYKEFVTPYNGYKLEFEGSNYVKFVREDQQEGNLCRVELEVKKHGYSFELIETVILTKRYYDGKAVLYDTNVMHLIRTFKNNNAFSRFIRKFPEVSEYFHRPKEIKLNVFSDQKILDESGISR